MPEGAVYVGRPTRWGNPFPVGSVVNIVGQDGEYGEAYGTVTLDLSIAAYRLWAEEQMAWSTRDDFLDPIKGRDLACWCPLDQPCHADVLLELANR